MALIVAFAFEIVAPGDFQLGQIVKQTLALAAYGWIGLHILRMTDAQWERGEQYVQLPSAPERAKALV